MRGFVLLVLAGLAAPLSAADLYVSISGNDAWSGKLPAPAANKKDGPLATLERARELARQLKATSREGVTIHVRGGTYFISKTFTLSKEDSGQSGAPITWRGYKDEMPVLIGGKLITHFTPYKGQILKADVATQGIKQTYFRQLIFNGERQHLARYPNFDPNNPYGGGWAYVDGKPVPMYQEVPGEDKRTFQYKPQDARTWAHPETAEVMVFPRYNWWNNIAPVASIDRESRTVKLGRDCSYPIRPTDRYYFRNVLEELDAPGEWFLDKQTWTLYFWPPSETKPGEVKVYVPTTRTILEITKDAAHIIVRNMVFECAEGTAITLKDTNDCLIGANIIRNVGDYGGSGVSVAGGKNNGVIGNDIHHTGSNGVAISGGDRITLTPANNYADNNYIHHVGVFYAQGVGVALNGCGNRASHNLIHDGPRMGIMFAGNNLVMEYNHIRHMNLETADTGAIYTGGRDWIGSRGSVIRYNYFHDILGYGQDKDGKWESPHFSWGVYLDDNTGGVDVIGNIVVGCMRGLIHLHNGRDNLVENNIFVDGKLQQIECNGWTPQHRYWTTHMETMVKGYESVINQPAWKSMRNMETHPSKAVLPDNTIMSGNVFQRNIVAWHDPDAKYVSLRNFSFAANKFDYNLVWHYGQPIKTGQSTIKGVIGQNLLFNGDFEQVDSDKLPAGWKWQHNPTNSQAGADNQQHAAGQRSLRIQAVTAAEAKAGSKFPVIVSKEFPATPGKTYRLRVKAKASEPGVKFALMAQSYVNKVYFWSKEQGVTLGTDWQDVELVCKLPSKEEKGYNEAMRTMVLRVEPRHTSGTVWIDEASVFEAVALDEWESWQQLKMDQHSVVADPMFVDADKGDYRLKPNSPASKIGFKPIPVEKIGPYADEWRASWPIVEATGAREKPLVTRK